MKPVHGTEIQLEILDTSAISKESDAITLEKNTSPPNTHWSAWMVTVCVMLVNMACAITWTTGASAPISMSEWMLVDLSHLNWLSNIGAISNAILSLLVPWAYHRLGIKLSIVISGWINVIGCWIRCISIIVAPEQRYTLILLGQVLASLGGPFVYNVAPVLVSIWFAPHHRAIGNTLATLSVGVFASPLIIPALAFSADQVPRTLIAVAILATASVIPIMFTPQKPSNSPSASAKTSRVSVWQGAKALAKNFQFWTICILTAVNAGMYFTITVVAIQAAAPYGYTEQQSGIAASILMLSGFFGGSLLGYWAGKTSQHLMIIKMFTPMLCGSYIMLIFEIVPNAFGVLISICFMIGFFSMGLLPVQLEYACEITYPIPESVSSNIIWSLSLASMLLFTLLTDALRAGPDADPPNNMKLSMIVSAVIICVGSIPCIWLNGDLKRIRVDKEALF